MNPLARRIASRIALTGPITVADFMAEALTHPQLGYYRRADPLGRGGDFITAPEISQMFGELVAIWLYSAWKACGGPLPATLAEIGPGRGTLMKDMLRTFARLDPQFAAGIGFAIIEASPRLAELQKQTLAGVPTRPEWFGHVDQLPDRPLFIVGNELFDALPVRQYVKSADGWRERVIGLQDDGSLAFMAGAGSVDAALLPPDATSASEGSVVELAPARSALMEAIAARLERDSGAGLFIDYGYERPAVGDTLQAVRRHAYDHVLAHPGEADLTAHVDFAALAEAARANGLDAHVMTQGDFLLAMGLLERAGRLGASRDAAEQERIRGEVDRLASPEAMGTLFKALTVVPKGAAIPPSVADGTGDKMARTAPGGTVRATAGPRIDLAKPLPHHPALSKSDSQGR